MSDSIRLSKCVTQLTGCSRREAELYIEGGWVTVDGAVVDLPQYPVEGQGVELLPGAVAEPLEPATLLLNVPVGYAGEASQLIRVDSHWSADVSRQRVLKGHFARLSAALPLQAGAGGLAVFSQDWRALRKLNDDSARIEQEYVAEVRGQISPGGLARLNEGRGCKVSWQNEHHLRFALKQVAPGMIHTLCAGVGLTIRTLKRIRIGGVPMGKMPPGQWRYLAPGERF
ncbi:RNA pseudouridine synthase [Stutzerimonas tarimensis]|uniref:Dual-specificity RNA pseudouridine synthase RluF n=1 Tax=Stutzerimonas tarimensis TaxID=1507735 RepID=A0ABV7T4L7_9GAMM